MTQKRKQTVQIDLLVRNADRIDAHDSLGSEGLVDFVEVNLFLADAGLAEQLGDGSLEASQHKQRIEGLQVPLPMIRYRKQ